MRIGFFSGSALSIGSGSAVVYPLARALLRQGHEVFVLETSRWRRGAFRLDGLQVCLEPLLPLLLQAPQRLLAEWCQRTVTARRGRAHALAPPFAYDLAVGAAQVRFAHRCGLDVLYTFHNVNALGVATLGVPFPVVLAINLIGFGIDPDRGGRADTFPYQRRLFESPRWDLHVVASHFEERQYRAAYAALGLPPEAVVYVPHSYDEERLRPLSAEARRALRGSEGVPPGEALLLYPVNVYRRKNVEAAIEVLARVQRQRPARLIVTGRLVDPAYARQLEAYAQRLGVGARFFLAGGLHRHRLDTLLRVADAVVWPSHQETFGLGMVEALGAGTPVVGPAWIPPCRELLAGQPGGYLAVRENFAEATLTALEGPPPRQQVAEAARSRWGNGAVALRFLGLVEPLVRQKRARREALERIDWAALYRNEYRLPPSSKAQPPSTGPWHGTPATVQLAAEREPRRDDAGRPPAAVPTRGEGP